MEPIRGTSTITVKRYLVHCQIQDHHYGALSWFCDQIIWAYSAADAKVQAKAAWQAKVRVLGITPAPTSELHEV